MDTLDLTRISVDFPQLKLLTKINNPKTQNIASLFTEVMFGDMRCCYLTTTNPDIKPDDGDLYTADIGTMSLPNKFMHLVTDGTTVFKPSGQAFNTSQLTAAEYNSATARDNIYTSILLNLKAAVQVMPQMDHFCKIPDFVIMGLGTYGCADVGGLLSNSTPMREHLFYYEGPMSLAIEIPDLDPELQPSFFIDNQSVKVYLLPFLLYEKSVAYYAIKANDAQVLTKIQQWFAASKGVSVNTPMQYNDDLGAFITSDAARKP